LKATFEECKEKRRLIFSSFDPDICLLLSLKQPRFPVFFLTEGGSALYPDARMNSLDAAIAFAKSTRLRGIVSFVDPVLNNPDKVKIAKNIGLAFFTYGEKNMDPKICEIQKSIGVDAIIMDRVFTVRNKDHDEAEMSPATKARKRSMYYTIDETNNRVKTSTQAPSGALFFPIEN